jgi:hypothetical protein
MSMTEPSRADILIITKLRRASSSTTARGSGMRSSCPACCFAHAVERQRSPTSSQPSRSWRPSRPSSGIPLPS